MKTLILILSLIATPVFAATVNVSNLLELYAAFSGEQDGDEIIIAAGTYTLNDATLLSIDAPNVTVRGATGNRDDVIIRGDEMSGSVGVLVIFYFPVGAYGQNATIKDLTIGEVQWHAIMFNGVGAGNGTTIDNVRIYNTYQQMLKSTVGATFTDNVTVKNSLFEFTTPPLNYYTGGIDAHSPDGWVIQDNEFRNINSPSGSVAEHAIHLWSNTGYSGSNTIERNKIVNCDRGIGIWRNSGVATVRNNMVMNDGSMAYPDIGIDIENSSNSLVYNNTVWIEPTADINAGISMRYDYPGVVFTNNLTNKNIWLRDGAVPTETTNVENAQSSWFVNVDSDLHLASSVESVVDQGTAVADLTDDYDGYARSGTVDIGADEYNNETAAPTSQGLSGNFTIQ